MDYGIVVSNDFTSFSDDEKLNYGLKIALSRLQTELKEHGIRSLRISRLRGLKLFTKIKYLLMMKLYIIT